MAILQTILSLLIYFNSASLSESVLLKRALDFVPFFFLSLYRFTYLYFKVMLSALLWPRSIFFLSLSMLLSFKLIWDIFLWTFCFIALHLIAPFYIYSLWRGRQPQILKSHHTMAIIKLSCIAAIFWYQSLFISCILVVATGAIDTYSAFKRR